MNLRRARWSQELGDGRLEAIRALVEAPVRAARVPGIQYVAVDREGVLCEHHAGYADLSTRRPIGPDTTMMAFSMSKTITALAVMQLIERGALRLDEPIARIVPWQPYGPEVTVRQLLCHTAGIPNPVPLRWVHPAGVACDERARLDAVLRRNPRLVSPPGARYAYSNIGYWLLGYAVEAAGGEDFKSYVGRHIATPLGGAGTLLRFDIADAASHARGYLERYSLFNLLKAFLIDRRLAGDPVGPWVQLHDLYADGPAFGGVVGSAGAFARLLQDQLGEHSVLLGDATRRLMQAPQAARRGPIPMTLGWHVGGAAPSTYFYKEGGGGGFHCLMRLYPAAGFGSVVMTNATLFNVGALLDAADALVQGRGSS